MSTVEARSVVFGKKIKTVQSVHPPPSLYLITVTRCPSVVLKVAKVASSTSGKLQKWPVAEVASYTSGHIQ